MRAEVAITKSEKTKALEICEDHDARFRRLDASIEALIVASTTTTAAAAAAAEAANDAKQTAKMANETAKEGMKQLLETLRLEDEVRMKDAIKAVSAIPSVAPLPEPQQAEKNVEESFTKEHGERLYQSVMASMPGGVLRLLTNGYAL